MRQLLAILLSLCLGLYLADAFVSLLDDALILFFNLHVLTGLRMIVGLFSLLTAVGVYGLIGLTPMVPKRLFLPIPLFHLAAILVLFSFAIYCYGRFQEVAVGISLSQVIVGLIILRWSSSGRSLALAVDAGKPAWCPAL